MSLSECGRESELTVQDVSKSELNTAEDLTATTQRISLLLEVRIDSVVVEDLMMMKGRRRRRGAGESGRNKWSEVG